MYYTVSLYPITHSSALTQYILLLLHTFICRKYFFKKVLIIITKDIKL